MTVISGNLYRALISANVSEEMASKAAEEVADFHKAFAEVRADLLVLKWVCGFNSTATVAIMIKLFIP